MRLKPILTAAIAIAIVTPLVAYPAFSSAAMSGSSHGYGYGYGYGPEVTEERGLGFWKNHQDEWVTYSPDDTVGSVFDLPEYAEDLGDDSLADATRYGGGRGEIGMARILLRHAVPALLNAEHPDVDYPMTSAEIVEAVNEALASGDRDEMADLKDDLESHNEAGED